MAVILCSRVMSTGKARTEIACTLSWFSNWSPQQREQFGNTLVDKSRDDHTITDVSLESLMSQLGEISLNRENKEGPSVFECQLKIFSKWYSSWDFNVKAEFANDLNSRYPDFMASLKTQIQ